MATHKIPDTSRVIDGHVYYRTYVCELEAGDITTFNETVVSIERNPVTEAVSVTLDTMGDTRILFYSHPDSTVLVRS